MKWFMIIAGLFVACAVSAEDVDYQVDGEAFEGYYLAAGQDAPLVIIVHDWDGLTGYEKKRASMLSDLGYAVFAVDLFGKGNRPTALEDKQRMTGALYADRARMRKLLYGALNAAQSFGAQTDHAVIMGYCFGGTAVLELARAGADLNGFVSFHGGLGTPEGQDYSRTKGSVMIFHGTADRHVSMDDFAHIGKEMEAAGVSHELISYGGAPHAFSVFGSDRYREDADQKSWRRFTQYLEQVLR